MQHGRHPLILSRLVIVAAASLAACGSGSDTPGEPDAGARVELDGSVAVDVDCEIGTGRETFVPLEPGDEVEIVAGPQGGYHIFTSVRIRGLTPTDALRITLTVRREVDGEYVGPTTLIGSRHMREADDGWLQATGMINLVNEPERVRGEAVVLRAEMLDDGVPAGPVADERSAVAR